MSEKYQSATYAPNGQTCHIERDNNGQWWIVWGPDFVQDQPGRREHPDSIFLEEAHQTGIKKGRQSVIEWGEEFCPHYIIEVVQRRQCERCWQELKEISNK